MGRDSDVGLVAAEAGAAAGAASGAAATKENKPSSSISLVPFSCACSKDCLSAAQLDMT